MYNLLLVEDNEDIQEMNQRLLERRGYTVRLAMNLAEARALIKKSLPDLILLDIMLPDGNGLDFLKELRKENRGIPVLLLTALDETDDELIGLQAGGDDYIAKPYKNELLLARIETLLRRVEFTNEAVAQAAAESTPDIMKYGSLTVSNITRRVSLNDEDVNLTPIEFTLLLFFLKNMGRQFSAEEIYEAVWGQDANNSVGTVKVRINGLRDKLKMGEERSVTIETVERKYYVCRTV
jgi:DNA-binding response OmpR family regulator